MTLQGKAELQNMILCPVVEPVVLPPQNLYDALGINVGQVTLNG